MREDHRFTGAGREDLRRTAHATREGGEGGVDRAALVVAKRQQLRAHACSSSQLSRLIAAAARRWMSRSAYPKALMSRRSRSTARAAARLAQAISMLRFSAVMVAHATD